MITPATALCDFYKISHADQYPPGTEVVYSTWIPRASKVPNVDRVVAFGFQYFVQKYLVDYFNDHFFSRSRQEVLTEYERLISHTLGRVDSSRVAALHDLGYLPLRLRAVPEGTLVPLRVPMLTIENTHPDFFWLTNYIETVFSNECWKPSTSATIAFMYRQLLEGWADRTDPEGRDFVKFQGHDFSMRGMDSLEAAMASGAGHLLSFVGTDTIPAIRWAEHYYGADITRELVGTSIPATEHSVMCAYGQDELTSYRRLVCDVHPTGPVSIVSDTWDLWQVLTKVVASLKSEILARDGKVVIRPDSGDPVKIVCGDPTATSEAARKGVVEVLWDIFGGSINRAGYKVLDPHIGVIYGDAITYDRAQQICLHLDLKGFASTNMVYGIGSFTYTFNTRDTFGFALKSTYARVAGKDVAIFKDPVTDTDKVKKSLVGRCVVLWGPAGLYVQDRLTPAEEARYVDDDVLEDIFVDGKVLRRQTFGEIREVLQRQLVAV